MPKEQEVQASVIIATLNGAETLPEALQSLSDQDADFPWEVVLADNGSTDTTREVFATWADLNSHIVTRIVDCGDRPGKPGAVNKAASLAASERLMFLDDDDALSPNYVSAMTRALDRHDMVASRLEYDRLNAPDVRDARGANAMQDAPLRLKQAPHCLFAAGSTLGIRRSTFDQIGGFDPAFVTVEDDEFFARAYLQGFRVVFVLEAHYHYRFRADTEAAFRQAYNWSKGYVHLRREFTPDPAWPSYLRWGPAVAAAALAFFRHQISSQLSGDKTAVLRSASRLGSACGDLAGAWTFRRPPRARALPGPARRLVSFAGRAFRRALAPAFPTIVCCDTTEPVIALTFDDGPDPHWTPQVLDALKEINATATFFLVGERAERHPELVARIAADGHEIGNHAWSHRSLSHLPADETEAEIARTKRALAPHGQTFFRPPYGDQTLATNRIARKLGYQVVAWSLPSHDWTWNDAEDIAERIVSQAEPGAIVLLHDTLRTCEETSVLDRTRVIEGLKLCAARLPQYRFVSVSEHLARGQAVKRCRIEKTPKHFLDTLIELS